MKQRRHLSNKLSATLAASILAVALTGVTCGTFAWFTYETRAKIEEFQGITIGVGDLQVGILSEAYLDRAEEYGLIRDESNPNETIYWFDGHTMENETINYVLSSNGYATNALHPVTSRKYVTGDPLTLYAAPDFKPEEDAKASKDGRIFLPLVFKYEDIIDDSLISNENIFLSDVKLSTPSSDSYIHRAVRVHTDNKNNNRHLINPTTSEDGSTGVGGVLDLNKDGFYDTEVTGSDLREHVYGQAEFQYKTEVETEDTFVPIEQRTTFKAGHLAGAYSLESCTPEKAEYEGFYGFRNKRKWVATTNPETNNYAYLDLSVFVEGWDEHVIDSERDLPFSMELKFEVVF
ncbi:MAG: hypothetical protein K6E11_01930 [Bacilli bacterium]|nr:hypothetical protein [Bacilli bacterium]